MSKVSFQLIPKNSDMIMSESNTLYDIWKFIRNHINVPDQYEVDELENGEVVDTVNAQYLITNYKDEKDLPLSLKDIPMNI